MVVGTVSTDIIHCMREGGISAEKHPMDIGLDDMVLEFGDILIQRREVCSVFLENHPLGGEPSDSGSGDVPLFEVFVELHNEV